MEPSHHFLVFFLSCCVFLSLFLRNNCGDGENIPPELDEDDVIRWNPHKMRNCARIILAVVATKDDSHRQISCGDDFQYATLNERMAWIMNIAPKCSHTDGGIICDGVTSQPAVGVLAVPVKFLCCPGLLGEAVEKPDVWPCFPGLPFSK